MILLAYGTKPEKLKQLSLIKVLKKNGVEYKTLFTGQHSDLLNDEEPDFRINIIDYHNRLDAIIKSIMDVFYLISLKGDIITYVLVQGDTTSAFAVALSAFNHGIKVIHLEAGLRTYDNQNPYPEESYRRMISQITDIHLCPTVFSKNNLEVEKILGEKYVVGNTVIDNLISYKDKCEYSDKILITLHRRENHHWIDQWFMEINKLAEKHPEYEFIFPVHPNPNVQKHKHLLKHVNIIDPLPYDKLLDLLVKTRLVITDSGGLQEECSYFNKKCLTCRIVTERPEAINQSTFMVENPKELNKIFETHHLDYKIDYICPFGNGDSSEKIYDIIKNLI